MNKRNIEIVIVLIVLLCSCRLNEAKISSFQDISFENSEIGNYRLKNIKHDWNDIELLCGRKEFAFLALGIYKYPCEIVNINNQKALRINFPANRFGPIPGSQWLSSFNPVDSATFEYTLYFPCEFDFVNGGKLPGLAGGIANSGGQIPTGYDGWSARQMFLHDGYIATYLYHPNQSTKFGDYVYWTDSTGYFQVPKGKWISIKQYIKMNDIDKANGELLVWVDGCKVVDERHIVFRKTNALRISKVFFSSFYGGNSTEWAPKCDQYILYDNLKVY